MLQIAIHFIATIVISITCIGVVKELLSIFSAQYYKKQSPKVSFIYTPIIGLYNYYILRKNSKDQLENMKKLVKEH